MFDTDRFVDDCRNALAEKDSHKAIRELLTRAVSEPGDVLEALGEPSEAGLLKLHTSDDLTILNVVWAPLMTLMPHNHNMWAVIGVYTGREDNIFWRRTEGDGVEAAGASAMSARDVHPLGKDIIHSVTNPIPRLTGALHIYGGDFFSEKRSEWDPETLSERPYDVEKNMRLFQEANARFGLHVPA
jgi:predicted metal-dependent enzyme (double-stranded beta helix superfamily)